MKRILLPILIFTLALAGCASRPTQSVVNELVISNPGKSLQVPAGNEFKIIIDSNPSTGYHWELIGELDETLLQFISKDYRADEPVLAGSGGSDVWTFKALAAGEAKIVLGYYPPAPGSSAAQEVTFTIIIK